MAEHFTKAFGRYLRTLRERRGLALHQVATLSQTFPERINKGYLSRCENGHCKLALSKVIPLSRIYDVPADALVERMELDLELDRLGGPDTEGMNHGQLLEAGKTAFRQGFRWSAYAYVREAAERSAIDPVRTAFDSRVQQVAAAYQAVGTAAAALGRFAFALHEFKYALSTGVLSGKYEVLSHERLATAYSGLREYEKAEQQVSRAIALAELCDDKSYLGVTFNTRASVAFAAGQPDVALSYFRKAYDVHKRLEQEAESVTALLNTATCQLEQKNLGAAERTIDVVVRSAEELGMFRTVGLALVTQGAVRSARGDLRGALRRWREAAEIGRRLNDRELRFHADLHLLRYALANDDKPSSRSISRRLDRLAPWLPKHMSEVLEFRALTQADPLLLSRKVSERKRQRSASGNPTRSRPLNPPRP